MILDTTVLVDLQRELRRNEIGPASRLLERTEAGFAVAFVTWMEFAEGFGDSQREACVRLMSRFRVLWPDADTSWLASRIARRLRSEGRPIGDHDESQ